MGLFVSFPWAACLLTHWSGIVLLFRCFHLVFNEIKAVLYSILLLCILFIFLPLYNHAVIEVKVSF